MRLSGIWPNWQDDSAYGYCAHLTSRGWTWEFLRRNSAFQRELAETLRSAASSRIQSLDVVSLPASAVDLSRWGLLFCKLNRQGCGRLLVPASISARSVCYSRPRCGPPRLGCIGHLCAVLPGVGSACREWLKLCVVLRRYEELAADCRWRRHFRTGPTDVQRSMACCGIKGTSGRHCMFECLATDRTTSAEIHSS